MVTEQRQGSMTKSNLELQEQFCDEKPYSLFSEGEALTNEDGCRTDVWIENKSNTK